MINHKLGFLILSLLISSLFWSCMDLEEAPFGILTPDNFLQTEDELLAAVIPVYAGLRQYSNVAPYSLLQELSSDQIVIPMRSGWDSDGTLLKLQRHDWTSTDSPINNAWKDAYDGIRRANSALDLLHQSNSELELLPILMAEVRLLRAFYYWWLLDLFGGVPIITDATAYLDNPPQQSTRQEVFDFIVEEINAALPDLQESPSHSGRVSKGAANTLLATVYLNAEGYTGTAMWNECVEACDAVINSGNYDLLSNFNDIFALGNEGPGNVENIFLVEYLPQKDVGFVRQMATLHYSQLPQSPWNGLAVLADFYNKYDTADVRLTQLLVGPQLVLGGPNAGQEAYDRNGNSLIFSVEIPSLYSAYEGSGVRILKWPVDPNQVGPNSGNDFAIFRYSHVLLTKAEALYNLGSAGEALNLVNQVRERAFEPDKPLTSITIDDILDERGYEFLWEGFRRQDLIRTGHFLEAWTLKEPSDGPHRELFPIPQTQLDANPNLIQNPGY